MAIDSWRQEILLKEGEQLVHHSSRTSGFMQEEDIETFLVQAADGSSCGTVVVSDHTAVKGFKRTIHVVQKDSNSKIIFDKRYEIPRG